MGYTKHDYQSNDILYAADLAEMDNQIYKNEQDILNLEKNKQPTGNYASSEEVSQLKSDLDELKNRENYVDDEGYIVLGSTTTVDSDGYIHL